MKSIGRTLPSPTSKRTLKKIEKKKARQLKRYEDEMRLQAEIAARQTTEEKARF